MPQLSSSSSFLCVGRLSGLLLGSTPSREQSLLPNWLGYTLADHPRILKWRIEAQAGATSHRKESASANFILDLISQ